MVDEILKLDCKKDKILDIGCGSGAISLALADNLRKSQIYGIDISKEAINLSKRNKEKIAKLEKIIVNSQKEIEKIEQEKEK